MPLCESMQLLSDVQYCQESMPGVVMRDDAIDEAKS